MLQTPSRARVGVLALSMRPASGARVKPEDQIPPRDGIRTRVATLRGRRSIRIASRCPHRATSQICSSALSPAERTGCHRVDGTLDGTFRSGGRPLRLRVSGSVGPAPPDGWDSAMRSLLGRDRRRSAGDWRSGAGYGSREQPRHVPQMNDRRARRSPQRQQHPEVAVGGDDRETSEVARS